MKLHFFEKMGKKTILILILFFTAGFSLQLFSKITVDMPEDILQQVFLLDLMADKVVEEEVETCCDTVNSKIDNIVIPELMSIESKLDYWVGPLVETIDSQIDVLDITVDNSPCATVNSKIDAVIVPDLQTIESKIDNLILDDCPFDKGSIITTGANSITTGGLYTLTVNTQGCVTIDADRVIIDLCEFTLSCDSPNAVIEVLPGHENIEIRNGMIEGASALTNDGILTGSDCQLIKLSNLMIYTCDNGIHFEGTATDFVKACDVHKCVMGLCNKGVLLEYSKKCVFKECSAHNCVEAGFELDYSNFNVFDACQALETSNDAVAERAVGFSSSSGTGNLFTECVAEGTEKTVDSDFLYGAIGFLLTGVEGDMEQETKIINCVANSCSVLSTGSAYALGIKLGPVLKTGTLEDLLVSGTDYAGGDAYYIDWSSDSRYFAVVGDQLDVSVYKVNDDGSVDFVTSYIVAGGAGSSFSESPIDWSPDGNFLAVGTNNGDTVILSFDGSNLTHVLTQAYGTTVYMVRWSPDGNYLAVGGDGPATPNNHELHIYSFNGTSVTFVDSYSTANQIVYTADWSPNGEYLAIGIRSDGFLVFSFDGSNISLVVSKDPENSVYDVNWSPDGRYLALAMRHAVSREILIYEFDGSSVTQVAFFNTPGDSPIAYSSRWSPDGKYLLITNHISSGSYEIFVRRFTGSSLVAEKSYEWGATVFASWAPNGKYFVAGGESPTAGTNIKLFSVMDAPSNCLIDGNRVCNASGGDGFHGIGILGTGENIYIRNVACENDVNYNEAIYPRFGDTFGPAFSGTPGIFDNLTVNY